MNRNENQINKPRISTLVSIFILFGLILFAGPITSVHATAPSDIVRNIERRSLNSVVTELALASIPHCGTITTSQTWLANGDVHNVTCNVTVPEGVSLTVEAGAIVKFNIGAALLVNGTLNAIGTEANRIFFTSIRDDTVGGDTNGDGASTTPAQNNWSYLEFKAGSTAHLDYITIRYSGMYSHSALFASGYSIPQVGDHVTLTNNWNNGIELPGGPIAASLTLPDYPAAAYYLRSDLTIPSNVTLTLQPGVVFKFELNKILYVNGTLSAVGSATRPIYFTSIRDDTVGGDTNGDGAATTPAQNNWGFIEFKAGSTTSLDYITIRYSGMWSRAALFASGYSIPQVGDHVTLTNNWNNGIELPGGPLAASLTLPDYPAAAYYLRSDLTIPSNVTLTLQPGVVVKIELNKILYVNGTLSAVGSATRPIYFTSIRDDIGCPYADHPTPPPVINCDTNGDGAATTPAQNNWGFIEFKAGSTAHLDYITIRYSGMWSRAALFASGYSIPQVGDHVSLTNNWNNGIELPGGTLSAASYTLPYYRSAAYYLRSDLTIPNNVTLTLQPGVVVKIEGGRGLTVDGTLSAVGTATRPIFITSTRDDTIGGDTNGDGAATTPTQSNWAQIEFKAGSAATLDYATIRYSGMWSRAALFASGYSIPQVGDHVSLTNNWNNGIELPGGTLSAASFTLPYYRSAAYYLRSDLTIPNNVTLTLQPGVVFKFELGKVLFVNGTLSAVGSATRPIYFTSIRDDTVGKDTNGDGATTTPDRGDWGWIDFTSTSNNSTLVWNVIRYGGGYLGADLHLVSASPSIKYTLITLSSQDGIRAENSNPSLICNDIQNNNALGIRNSTTSYVIDARNQYWGTPSGPKHPTLNPAGIGNEVSDGVIFSPWKDKSCRASVTPPSPKNHIFLPAIIGL